MPKIIPFNFKVDQFTPIFKYNRVKFIIVIVQFSKLFVRLIQLIWVWCLFKRKQYLFMMSPSN